MFKYSNILVIHERVEDARNIEILNPDNSRRAPENFPTSNPPKVPKFQHYASVLYAGSYPDEALWPQSSKRPLYTRPLYNVDH